jgi:signal transduction histidine kinase
MAAAAVFTAVAGDGQGWPLVLLGALLAVGVDSLVNYGGVAGVLALHDRIPYSAALSQLHFGSPLEFAATWATFGLLSLTLVETYESAGLWALIVFTVPLVLARQALASGRRLDRANRRIVTQSEALRASSATLVDERRDERLALAAGIHDELLPPLFKVHLMGQVLRQDLATGQLLALEEDLPELLRATDKASESMRALVRGLRESPIGNAGLASALTTLAGSLRVDSGVPIEVEVRSEIQGSRVSQLLVYQVAREAVRNAIRHAHANIIRVSLEGDESHIGLVVEDDGFGFVPALVDRNKHFGLELMRERAELAGGILQVDSKLGIGTIVSVHIPTGRLEND